MGDRMTLQETVWTVEEEAYTARVAWNHSIGLNSSDSTPALEYSHSDTAPGPANRGPSPCQRHEAGDGRHADRIVVGPYKQDLNEP
ncbi:hypothetical protein Tco_0338650 [Tanacetum coccineum]